MRAVRPTVRACIRYGPQLPGRGWLWYSVAKAYAWEAHDFTAKTTFGATIKGNSQDLLQQFLYYFGVWEPDTTAWLERRLRPGDVFVDVGANIGYYALLASRLVGDEGGVLAVEASPMLHRCLVENLRENGATNVRSVNMAAGRMPGVTTVYEGPVHHRGLTTIVPGTAHAAGATVPMDTLSDILTADEVERARIIKIDVEGAEAAVVDGLAPVLDRAQDDLELIVEIGPDRLADQGLKADDIFAVFADAGFVPYRLRNDYGDWRYLTRQPPSAPVRFDGPVECEGDFVFSRIDAATL